MKRWIGVIALVVLLSSLASTALAEHGEPLAGCPNGFHLHHMMHHDGNHEGHHHHHVGLKGDLNEDGYICMKHVTPDGRIHVHVDNRVPLR
jgi:hypothetical protein